MSTIAIILIVIASMLIFGVFLIFVITLGFANLILQLCGMEEMGLWEAIKEMWKDRKELFCR